MKKATTTYSLKAARALEAYDVLQIRTEKTKVDHRDRDGWLDLSTLRSDADFATATRYVTTLRVDAEYRVVSMNKRDVVLSMVAHEALTVKRTREVVRSFGLTMSAKRNSAGDFRINFPNGGEATAYYSNDLDEIVGTAKAMGDELIAHNAQRDREVADLKAQQARASRDEPTRCVNCGELPADGHIQGCSADGGAEFCARHRAEINERLTIADVAALRRPYSVEQADARAAAQSVEHVERLAYGRAESYMRPLGATQTSDEYTGAGASQVLADEYEESVSADENDDDSENDEQKLVGGLVDVLFENRKEIEGLPSPIKYVETFDEARAHGLLTDDAGLVLVLVNGTRVFLTVQVQ